MRRVSASRWCFSMFTLRRWHCPCHPRWHPSLGLATYSKTWGGFQDWIVCLFITNRDRSLLEQKILGSASDSPLSWILIQSWKVARRTGVRPQHKSIKVCACVCGFRTKFYVVARDNWGNQLLKAFRLFWGFPCGSPGKESAHNAGDLGPIPWIGKIPWRREKLPTPVFWPGEFHGLYSPWARKQSDTTEWSSYHTFPSNTLLWPDTPPSVLRAWKTKSSVL